MGSYDPLKENKPVEIEVPMDGTFYRSRVEAVFEDKLIVAAPLKGGEIVPLLPGSVLKVTFTDNVAIYTYTGEVIAYSRGTPPTITLGQPFDVKRIQRRNFVRLDTRLNATLQKLDENMIPIDSAFQATAIDLSGGGMMFTTNEEIQFGDTFDATIFLSDKETVKALGRVVRVSENAGKAKVKYSMGFEFTMIEEVERDRIIRFIFNQQRELRRRGLL